MFDVDFCFGLVLAFFAFVLGKLTEFLDVWGLVLSFCVVLI